MMRRMRASLNILAPGVIYLSAGVLLLALIANTIDLARQAAAPPQLPTPTVAQPTATARPLPSPIAPTPQPALVLPEISANADQRAANFHPKTGRYISAWLPNSFDTTNRQSFEANADILDEISPFWYTTDSRGNLYHGSDARDQTLIELAHSKNVLVIPTIHNIVNGNDPVPALISSPERRKRHISAIIEEVLANNYDGIDIDYELLDSDLRKEYSAFITELAAALHEQGKLLTIAVHAKDCDYCGLGGYQDWTVLGKAVDRLRIMTYDYHWRGGGPGPVAPIYWVNRVAEYARSVVDPAKVVVGVPFYGYDWPTGGGDAKALTWDIINDLIQRNRLEKSLVESDANGLIQENRIIYSSRQGRRTVYFATSRSLDAKLALVQELDLAGIAIWRLGGEDPENWKVIRSRLIEDPFESQRMLNQALPEH